MFREGISTLNIRSILREPLDFIYFLCYNLLIFKNEIEWWLKEKKNIFIYIFYWFGRTGSFAYYTFYGLR